MDFTISNHVPARPPTPPLRADGNPAGAPQGPQPRGDSVAFSDASVELARYVKMARAEPETRPDVVALFRERLASGVYPPPAIIEGLEHLLGGSLRESLGTA